MNYVMSSIKYLLSSMAPTFLFHSSFAKNYHIITRSTTSVLLPGLCCNCFKMNTFTTQTNSPNESSGISSHSSNSSSQQKINVNNININYQKIGTGSIPVLCLPGALGFIDSDFGPLLPKFNLNQFTIVVWDPPGYGKSRPPDREFKRGVLHMFQTDAFLANSLMHHLGFGKYSTIGWSDGGITALLQAIKFPNSINKMIVFGANAYINNHDINMYMKIRDIDTWSPKMKTPLIEMYGEKYFRKTWTNWVDACIEQFAKGGDICKDEIKNIKCPTFIIHGLKDPMVGLEHAEYLQQHIKDSKLHLMPEGKHNLHLRFPNEFIKLVETFLLSEEPVSSSSSSS